MAPSAQAHRRSHSLLLFQKLLNLRDSASPLTLVLDTLEQSAAPIIQEFITRAKISHTKIIFISFATIKKPSHADVFVKARGKALQELRNEIVSHYPVPSAPPSKKDTPSSQKTLLLIDTLNPLAATHPSHLTALLTSLLTHPSLPSLVAVYHADVPLPPPPHSSSPARARQHEQYEPPPPAVLHHLATAVLRAASLPHALARRRAEHRSLPAPAFGLDEAREGVLVGLRGGGGGVESTDSPAAAPAAAAAFVVEMELRRRSGRAVVERFVLSPGGGGSSSSSSKAGAPVAAVGGLSLLSDHPAFAAPELGGAADQQHAEEDGGLAETTFSLGLTDKQRRDREGVVLPYFDAQEDVGGGEGGRILYEMGREDDFDDEEDEI